MRQRVAQIQRLRIAVPSQRSAARLRIAAIALGRGSERALVGAQAHELAQPALAHELLGTDERRRRGNRVDRGRGSNHCRYCYASQESIDRHRRARRPLFVALVHHDVAVGARRQTNRKRAQGQGMRQQCPALMPQCRPERTRSSPPRPRRAASQARAERVRQRSAPQSAATIGAPTASSTIERRCRVAGQAEDRLSRRARPASCGFPGLDAQTVYDDARLAECGHRRRRDVARTDRRAAADRHRIAFVAAPRVMRSRTRRARRPAVG